MKRVKMLVSLLLAAAVTLFHPAGVPASEPSGAARGNRSANETAVDFTKNEVIYGVLSACGEVDALYAVNHFELPQPGWIRDCGDYTAVANLSGAGALPRTNGSLEYYAEAKDFYYRGDLASKTLPWNFNIMYFLDGNAISPPAAAGRSGTLEIRIEVTADPAADPVFYENYTVQVSLTLDTEKCGAVEAPGATVAEAGSNKLINFMVLPGQGGTLRLRAEITDFSMAGIEISAVPLSLGFDLPDTNQMAAQFQSLADAVSALREGASRLQDGAAQLAQGADTLVSGSAQFKDGLSALDGNSAQLSAGSAQIAAALAYIADALGSSALSDPETIAQLEWLPESFSSLAGSLTEISAGLRELKAVSAPAYAALDAAIGKIPAVELSPEEIAALSASAAPEHAETIAALAASYQAAQVVKQTYSQVKSAFGALASGLDTLASAVEAVSGAAGKISGVLSAAFSGADGIVQLQQMADGIAELSGQYAELHAGLLSYTDGTRRIAAEYGALHAGIVQLGNGAGGLNDGLGAFLQGLTALDAETAGLPDRLRAEIDDLTGRYGGADFKAVSFLSAENNKIGSVQFVLKCAGIEPDKPEAAPASPAAYTFWDRLKALFGERAGTRRLLLHFNG